MTKEKKTRHTLKIAGSNMKKSPVQGGCKECQASCQSACKTSCTVANQGCVRD